METTPTSTGAGKGRRRRFQFTLRTLMLFVTAFAVLCSWASVEIHDYRRRQRALEAVFPFPTVSTLRSPMPTSWPSTWIIKLFVDWNPQVVTYARADSASDEQMLQICRLRYLKILVLEGSDVTDRDLVHLHGLSKLDALSLNDTRVTDSGLCHLTRLPSLESLDVSDTQISGASLARFPKLRDLKLLIIDDSQAAEGGTALFAGSEKLETLVLHGWTRPNDTDEYLGALRALPKNSSVVFAFCGATDDGIKKLSRERPDLDLKQTVDFVAHLRPPLVLRFRDWQRLRLRARLN